MLITSEDGEVPARSADSSLRSSAAVLVWQWAESLPASTSLGTTWPLRALRRAVEVVTVPFQGEHYLRCPLREVQAAGLQIERRERFKLGLVERLAAREPAAGWRQP